MKTINKLRVKVKLLIQPFFGYNFQLTFAVLVGRHFATRYFRELADFERLVRLPTKTRLSILAIFLRCTLYELCLSPPNQWIVFFFAL